MSDASPAQVPAPVPDQTEMDGDVPTATIARHVIEASEGTLVVHDHHVHVDHPGRRRPFDLAAREIRRIQLDLEIGRPATIAIVPNSAEEVEFLTVRRDQFDALGTAIQHLAIDLDDAGDA